MRIVTWLEIYFVMILGFKTVALMQSLTSVQGGYFGRPELLAAATTGWLATARLFDWRFWLAGSCRLHVEPWPTAVAAAAAWLAPGLVVWLAGRLAGWLAVLRR